MMFFLCFLVLAVEGGLERPEWSIRAVTPMCIRLDVTMPDAESTEPAYARLVPAPGGLVPEVRILDLDTVTVTDARLAEFCPPDDLVGFGQVMTAAGVDVVPLHVARIRTGAKPGQIVRCRRMSIELTYSVGYESPGDGNLMSELVRSLVLGGVPEFSNDQPGCLVIVPDDFYSNVLPLARWKERKGYCVWVKKTSETGTTREQIQAYIRTAYQTWTPKPSYVMLVGAINKIPAFHYSIPQHVSDHPYSCVDGDDFLADLFVGRLPAANASELDVIVAKILGYEANPYLADTTWYRRALAVGTSYQEGGTPAVTAIVTKRVIRERLLTRGFSSVDTVFYPPTRYGRGPVDSSVNQGVAFINGRGWGNYDGWGYPEFLSNDVAALANGWKLPVVTSIYCGTGNYARNPCFGEVWLRAGTPTNPKGGVAFWGASWTGTSTRWNNCMDYGIYRAILDWNVLTCGPAMYLGKIEQLENFPLAEDSFDLRAYFQVYNLLGDPSLQMWTSVPRCLNVSHPASFFKGSSVFDVTVTDASGFPVRDAVVCLRTAEGSKTGRTDVSGRARFAIFTQTTDTMLVTVTGPNLAPYLGHSVGVPAGVFVGYESHMPSSVQPGGPANIAVTLKNYGSSLTAHSVVARLRAQDSFALVTDSVRSFGDLAPGASYTAPAFEVTVAAACTSGQTLGFELAVTSTDSAWNSAFEVTVTGPTLVVTSYTVHDANGFLDPGETVSFSTTVRNHGAAPADSATGLLVSLNPGGVKVLDSLGTFGTIAPAESASNITDRFLVRAEPDVGVGRKFTLRLVVSAQGGVRQVRDFTVVVGEPRSDAPLGPDRHGYYAYDDTDVGYGERPLYDWFEIDPGLGGPGTAIELGNDQVRQVDLPFNFRFYGRDYARVGVCDNGYLAFDANPQGEIYNWHIPSASGPDGLIAVFWDDFRADSLPVGGVFGYYDLTGHRFIVEWSRCVHVHGFRPPIRAEQQSFQVFLLDPAFHQTKTGDGPILCQYRTVQNDDSLWQNSHNFATVGIMNPDHSDGIEYTFAGAYPAAAAEVLSGRAIRFTTNPPDTFIGVRDKETGVRGQDFGMRLSPNPIAGGFASLRLHGFQGLSVPELSVFIYNAAGRCVLNRSLVSSDWSLAIPLDCQSLPSGVYLVQLSVAKQRMLHDKLLVLSGHR